MHGGLRKTIDVIIYAAMAAAILISLYFYFPAHRHSISMEKELKTLNDEYARKTREAARLAREVHDLESKAFASERVAREKFNLCREGEIIIRYDR